MFRDRFADLLKVVFGRSFIVGVIMVGVHLPVQIYGMEPPGSSGYKGLMGQDQDGQKSGSFFSNVVSPRGRSFSGNEKIQPDNASAIGESENEFAGLEVPSWEGGTGAGAKLLNIAGNNSGQQVPVAVAAAGMTWNSEIWDILKDGSRSIGSDGLEFPTTFSAQSAGGGTGGLGVGLPTQGSSGPPGTRFIPMLSISERYDSNVFFVPKIPGLRLEDYVTTVSPQLFVQDSRSFAFTTLNIGAVGEYYAVNRGLSYIGYNAGVTMNLTPLVQRYFPGATFRVSDAYTYTPNPPGFLNGNHRYSGMVDNEILSELPISDQYINSLQAFRVNTKANALTVNGSVPFTPTIGMQGSYSYAVLEFGQTFSPQQQQSSDVRFNSLSTHTVTVGPTAKLSPRDTVFVNYSYSQTRGDILFESHAATLGWATLLSSNWVARLFGGVSFLQQEGTPSQTVGTGGASLQWIRGRTSAGLTYNVGIFPSYINSGGALLSNTVSLTVTHQVLDNLLGSMGGSYGRDTSISSASNQTGQANVSFDTAQGFARMSYIMSRSVAFSLGYTISYNKGTFSISAPGDKQEVIRQTVTLMLSTFWQP